MLSKRELPTPNFLLLSTSSTVTATILLVSFLGAVSAAEQTISERMLHHRAIDAVVWAIVG